eukprot:Partr_v1_DN27730_c0_g1_i3_m67106 putative rho GTPase activating protein
MTIAENLIIRVEIPELQLTKAISVAPGCTISDLLILLGDKLDNGDYFRGVHAFLPLAQGDKRSLAEGQWIFDESTLLSSLFPADRPKSGNFMQLRHHPNDYSRNASSAPSSRRTSHNDISREICQYTTPDDFTNGSHAPDHLCNNHHQLDDAPLFNSLKKKKSIQRLGMMASKHLKASNSISGPILESNSSSQVFAWFGGCPLEAIPKNLSTGCPVLVDKLLDFIELNDTKTEGIFRLSGASTLISKLQDIFQASASGGADVDLNALDMPMDGHVAASLLKQFLRKLPEPLLVSSMYPAWIMAQATSNQKLRMYWIFNMLRALPRAHFALLKRVCLFLEMVSQWGHFNKMTLQNLATVLGPNILREDSQTPTQLVANAGAVNSIALELIKHAGVLFRDSPELANESLAGLAISVYPYAPSSGKDELSFDSEDVFFIKESADVLNGVGQGWWMAEIIGKGNSNIVSGYVPSNYIRILGKISHSKVKMDSVEEAVTPTTVAPVAEPTPLPVVIAMADASMQTVPSPDYKKQILQLQKDNVSLRNEIIRLKSMLLVVEPAAISPAPQESNFVDKKEALEESEFQYNDENRRPSGNSLRKSTKRAPPPAPPTIPSRPFTMYNFENSNPLVSPQGRDAFDKQLEQLLDR